MTTAAECSKALHQFVTDSGTIINNLNLKIMRTKIQSLKEVVLILVLMEDTL